MQPHDLLTSVAQIEYDALVQDAEQAVKGLKRQRQSVVDAIRAAQATNEDHNPPPDANLVLVTELQERLRRLNAALDLVTEEINQYRSNTNGRTRYAQHGR